MRPFTLAAHKANVLEICNVHINHLRIYLVFTFVLGCCGIQSQQTGSNEYCASESFEASCGQNEAILMDTALYGRMKEGRCISAEYELSIGCYADVLSYMDLKCSGRQTCTLLIATLEAVAQPCAKDFKPFLEATYTCVKVLPTIPDTCRQGETAVNYETTGYIATGLHDQSISGLLCRWSLQVKAGQQVSLSLFAFDLMSLLDWDNLANIDSESCVVNININEGSERTNIDVCDVRQREKEIYVSHSNNVLVELSFSTIMQQVPHFLLRYKAVGCPDLEPVGNIWVKRKGDHLFLRCNDTNQNWFLTCRDDHWIGEMGNCTSDTMLAYENALGSSGNYQRAWVVFAIIIGIVLGLLAGTGLLTLALMWRKRSKEERRGVTVHTDERNADSSLMNKSSYPALLHQEKAMGGNISEYTHVWEMHPLDLAHDPLNDPTYVCRRHLCEYHQQTFNKDIYMQHGPTSVHAQRNTGEMTPGTHHTHNKHIDTCYDPPPPSGQPPDTGTGPADPSLQPLTSNRPPTPLAEPMGKQPTLPNMQNTRNQLVLLDIESNRNVDSSHPAAADL